MIPQPLQTYFFFGTCVRYLQGVQAGYRIGDTDEGLFVRSNLEEFFKYMRSLNLKVSLRMPETDHLWKVLKELRPLNENAALSKQHATSIRTAVEAMRGTLEAELVGMEAYTVTPKRYDTEILLTNIGELFAPGAFQRLPAIAQYDLTEAGKCLAFERPTATAFHLLRATEAVLRTFYMKLARRSRVSLMRGPIVADLRKRRSSRGYEVLLDNLDNIRRSFRNPTQHPDAIYDIHGVQDLLGLCLDAINRMARALT